MEESYARQTTIAIEQNIFTFLHTVKQASFVPKSFVSMQQLKSINRL